MNRISRITTGALIATAVLFIAPAYAEVQFKWAPYLRLRHELWSDVFDMDKSVKNNRSFFRIKTSVWGQADVDEDLTLFAKLSDEFRAYTYFGGTSSAAPDKSGSKKGYHFDINEVVFDNLYMDLRNFLEYPLDLRIGRQDLLFEYGEGFLIMEGTPQDGSRTYYFNAAKANWKVNEKNQLDILYINNPRSEKFFPVINRAKLKQQANLSLDKAPQALNTTDEQGGVLYWKNKAIENLKLEAYYIFKNEEDGGAGLQAQKGKINTFGFFTKYDLSSWTARGQFAYQTGNYGENDRQGFGGYTFLDKCFKDVCWLPQVSMGYIYLSGDDQKTGKNEAWDPLFSRWNWVSELYVLSIGTDTGVLGYWTNLGILRAELLLKPTDKMKLSFWYNYLRANEQASRSAILSGEGKDRGHLPQARIDYFFNKTVSAYFLAEYLFAGDFYRNRDNAVFLRTELQFKF
ncbi:MAG: alginate export family protein [Candidatus Omnitrophica bacterium]|nr:alginate export family protein [Candidatus Omnitrophota bacterium]MDD5552821.1 alginate export family protein [Candidatus Omnitrophota bacterium]